MQRYSLFLGRKEQHCDPIYRFNEIPIKLPNGIFHRTRTNSSSFVRKHKRPHIAKAVLRKKNRAGVIKLPDFRLHYKATVIKTVWYRHKDRSIDPWNTAESPETNTCTCGHLFFDKGGKNIQWRQYSLFDKWCWENQISTCKRMKLEHALASYPKINSKWIEDLNVRPDTIKFLEENISRTFFDVNHSNFPLDPAPIVIEIKINK